MPTGRWRGRPPADHPRPGLYGDGPCGFNGQRWFLVVRGEYPFEEVSITNVNGRPFSIQTIGPGAKEFPSNAVEAEVLMAAIVNMARGVAPAQVFVNADRAVPFAGPDMTPAPPPSERSPDKQKNGRSL